MGGLKLEYLPLFAAVSVTLGSTMYNTLNASWCYCCVHVCIHTYVCMYVGITIGEY